MALGGNQDPLKVKAKVNSRTLCSRGAYLMNTIKALVITLAIVIVREVRAHGWGVGGNIQRVEDGSVRGNPPAFKAESTDHPIRSRNTRKAHVLYF